MLTTSKPAEATRISQAMQRYAAIPLRAIAGGGFVQHGWAKISKGPDAFAAILQALHVPFPHRSAYLAISKELARRSSASSAPLRLAKRTDVSGPLTAMFTVNLRTASVPSKSKRSWMAGRSSDLRDMNATFFISRASWLSCSSTQARGLSTAIACGSATPEFPPRLPDDEGAW